MGIRSALHSPKAQWVRAVIHVPTRGRIVANFALDLIPIPNVSRRAQGRARAG